MFVIQLNQIEGAELILKALRERAESKGCIASADLATGIELNLVYVDTQTGVAYQIGQQKKAPTLRVVQ